jgi:hypothetical protein
VSKRFVHQHKEAVHNQLPACGAFGGRVLGEDFAAGEGPDEGLQLRPIAVLERDLL